ncbi:MAG: UDP-N-acetylglucosamine--N-acetylmuramyl-(pentapeptide) pyrophosphoryl-undecaprenol N-acetylglucosamine transferase, partial [Pseudomonadota bacterium]|nr:UDP-N-acetylglucosamine--N-acetylmuramyl-(pentapeptide) pyrophosphoryl-undecaprenol N-acetylglucosamine transferase [Pseudomonadota bacterium]
MSLITLAAGGTGGHVFPALALARSLSARGHSLRLVTDQRGLAFAGDFDPAGIDVISAGGLVSGAPHRRAAGLFRLARGYVQARSLLRRHKPAAVVGFGGFPSAPPMLAAQHLGLPTLMHEQNGIMGRANAFVSRQVRQISAAFPQLEGVPTSAQDRVSAVGNPIRADIAAVGETAFTPPKPEGALNLLVFGGSQGAAVFASLLPAALNRLSPTARARLHLVAQIRDESRAETEARLAILGLGSLEIAPFFADMPARLAAAHLVLSRSGATTVHELAAAGRPAVFVPLSLHRDDQQARNARLLTDPGAALLVREGADAPQRVATHLSALLAAPEVLADMAAKARASAL